MPVMPTRGGAGRKEREREGKINTKREKKEENLANQLKLGFMLQVLNFILF